MLRLRKKDKLRQRKICGRNKLPRIVFFFFKDFFPLIKKKSTRNKILSRCQGNLGLHAAAHSPSLPVRLGCVGHSQIEAHDSPSPFGADWVLINALKCFSEPHFLFQTSHCSSLVLEVERTALEGLTKE